MKKLYRDVKKKKLCRDVKKLCRDVKKLCRDVKKLCGVYRLDKVFTLCKL